MVENIGLSNYQAESRHYHIQKCSGLTKEEQVPHYHSFYQIAFMINGRVQHLSDNSKTDLSSGDAFIIPPGYTHSLRFTSASTDYYLIGFEETLFALGFPQSNAYRFLADLQEAASGMSERQVLPKIVLGHTQRELIQSLLHCLIRQQNDDTCPPGLTSAPSLVAAILYLIAQNYYEHPQQEYSNLANYDNALMQCLEYIDAHYKEPLTPADIAKRFGLSRSVFFAIFPQLAGMNFRQYVTHKRITEAQIMIRTQPNLSLSQISSSLGYENDSTFYRNFSRVTGVSPSQYKKMYTKD